MTFPKDLLYTKDSSWVKDEGNNVCSLGMVQESVNKAKEIVFVNLPKVGDSFKKGDVYCSVESIKWSGALTIPFDCTVIFVNDELFDEPERINVDSYKEWLVKVKVNDSSSYKNDLLDAESAKNKFL